MWFKVAFFVAAYVGLWASLAFVRHSLWVTAALMLLLSMVLVGLAYNVAHDAVHGALSRRRWVNELFFYVTFNLFGPNAYLWRYRHTVMHHSAVNVPGFDFNIEAADILRFSPTQTWRPMHASSTSTRRSRTSCSPSTGSSSKTSRCSSPIASGTWPASAIPGGASSRCWRGSSCTPGC